MLVYCLESVWVDISGAGIVVGVAEAVDARIGVWMTLNCSSADSRNGNDKDSKGWQDDAKMYI